MLVGDKKDYLVSAELAKEKLASILEQVPDEYAYVAMQCIELIRNTDLTDCQHPEGFRRCEFCGCMTNAKLRACCHAGRTADKDIAPAPDQGSVPAMHDRGCALFTDAVNPCDCRLADQGSVRNATDERIELLLKFAADEERRAFGPNIKSRVIRNCYAFLKGEVVDV